MKKLAYCWSCGKEHDLSKRSIRNFSDELKCDCGGYVITPSCKINCKLVAENDNERILLGEEVIWED